MLSRATRSFPPGCFILAWPIRLQSATAAASMSAAPVPPTILPGDLLVKEHILKVPLDHSVPDGPQLELFVRELVLASKADDASLLPCLLYLQGGPGYPSGRPTCPPGGWQKAALADHRVLLLLLSPASRCKVAHVAMRTGQASSARPSKTQSSS